MLDQSICFSRRVHSVPVVTYQCILLADTPSVTRPVFLVLCSEPYCELLSRFA